MGLITGLIAAIIVLILLVAYLADQIIRLNTGVDDAKVADHAMCVAHIADVVSDRFAAVLLRDLARRWDSVEEKPNLQRLTREYKVGGPSMPTIWLNQQADLLDPPRDRDEEPMYDLSGKRVL